MNKPLLICMTPVRNEAWVLNAFLKATSLWADYIIIADQNSTDGSREIALTYPKVILVENNNPNFNEAERQKILIDKARQIEGDKILFALDADEIFSANFAKTDDWQKILNSQQGDVFWFKWALVCPDKVHYWDHQTFFPWVFHDDGKEQHGNYVRNIHSMRIPYPIEEKQMYYVNDFEVLHFQYVFFERNLSKQRFYMFVDYSMNKRSTVKLSRTYLQKGIKGKYLNLNEKMIYLEEINGFDLFDFIDTNSRRFWFDKYLAERILQNGEAIYKNIDIWNASFLEEYNFTDPRNWSLKLLHFYLRNTQSISTLFTIRFIDKIFKKIGI